MNTSRTLDAHTFYTRNYADFNIRHELDNNYMNLDVVDLKFQGELKWKPIKGLELGVLGAAKFSETGNEHIMTPIKLWLTGLWMMLPFVTTIRSYTTTRIMIMTYLSLFCHKEVYTKKPPTKC